MLLKVFYEPEELITNLNKTKIEFLKSFKSKEKNDAKLVSLITGNIQAK